MKLTLVIFLAALWIVESNAANILGVFPVDSKSHLIAHMSIIAALVERGHNVTVVTTLPLDDKAANLHHIYIPTSDRRLQQLARKKNEMTRATSKFQMTVTSTNVLLAMGLSQVEVFKHSTFQDFMKNPNNKFDLLIVGYFFNDYVFGLGVHFECPIVISWTGPPNTFVGRHIGNPVQLSYATSLPLLGIWDPLKFTGRLKNFIGTVSSSMLIAILRLQMTKFYGELFPRPEYPTMDEAGKKVSLVLCNSHFTEGIIRPNVPALIEIGGIQIKEKPEPLPTDLQEILDGAGDIGAIYISFGSTIGDSLNLEITGIVFRVLSSLQQTILWQWDSEDVPGKSPNIHFRQWVPQVDVLGHPNLRLFITHAGKGSVSDSQYQGVPMVAIPIFADQPANADQITRNGFGRQVNVYTMTEMTLRKDIFEVLENGTYRANIKKFSTLYRDRPMTAKDTAVYWIEYVIRRKGAYHMQSPLVHLTNFQYVLIDVLAFLFAVIFVSLKLIKIFLRLLVRKMFRPRCEKLKAS